MISRLSLRLMAATALLSLTACDAAQTLVGRDPYVRQDQVDAAALRVPASASVNAFYTARNWAPAWTQVNAAQLAKAFDGAWAHGLDPQRFKAMISSRDPTERETQLTAAALAYAAALDHGVVDPRRLFEIYAIDVNATDLPAGLSQALDSGDLAKWLNGLAPQDAEYAALSKAYLTYRDRAAKPQPAVIPEGEALKPGVSDPRVPQLTARLKALGFLADAQTSGDLYTDQIAQAVKDFQNEQGIKDDGEVGPDTLAVLNAGADDRARQIAINLEARRWLPRNPAGDRIDVNLPASFLVWYRGGTAEQSRRVVVGSPKNQTPHLSEPFEQVVVNPPWNVPDGIAAKEIFPKGPGYLAANDMYVADGRVIQRPGPKAALGQVKFDMQNQYAIYLHDTPSKAFFSQNERYLSHGCVRVDGAVDFAREIAQAYGDPADFSAKLAAGKTAVVKLKTAVPVRLLYHTAFIDSAGKIAFRPDMYGHDEVVAKAMNLPAPLKRTVVESEGDVGP